MLNAETVGSEDGDHRAFYAYIAGGSVTVLVALVLLTVRFITLSESAKTKQKNKIK